MVRDGAQVHFESRDLRDGELLVRERFVQYYANSYSGRD